MRMRESAPNGDDETKGGGGRNLLKRHTKCLLLLSSGSLLYDEVVALNPQLNNSMCNWSERATGRSTEEWKKSSSFHSTASTQTAGSSPKEDTL